MLQSPLELTVLAQPVAIPADVHNMAMVDERVDERNGHDFITEHLAQSLLLVRIFEACSYRRVSSWKNSIAPVRVIGSS